MSDCTLLQANQKLGTEVNLTVIAVHNYTTLLYSHLNGLLIGRIFFLLGRTVPMEKKALMNVSSHPWPETASMTVRLMPVTIPWTNPRSKLEAMYQRHGPLLK